MDGCPIVCLAMDLFKKRDIVALIETIASFSRVYIFDHDYSGVVTIGQWSNMCIG